MIRLLADENVPFPSIRRLRDAGCDVAEVARGASDVAVLSRAAVERRVLLTFDRDFGRLALGAHLPQPAGIVLFRLLPADPLEAAEILLPLLRRAPDRFEGRLTVVRRDRVRQRPLERRT